MCTIIADSLMSTSNEMCGGFFVHTMKYCYATAMLCNCTAMQLHCIRKRYPLHMRV